MVLFKSNLGLSAWVMVLADFDQDNVKDCMPSASHCKPKWLHSGDET